MRQGEQTEEQKKEQTDNQNELDKQNGQARQTSSRQLYLFYGTNSVQLIKVTD